MVARTTTARSANIPLAVAPTAPPTGGAEQRRRSNVREGHATGVAQPAIRSCKSNPRELNRLDYRVWRQVRLPVLHLWAVQGTVPGEFGVALNQGTNITATWQAVAGAVGYIVYGFGTDGVAFVASRLLQPTMSATLPGTGGLICAQVLP